jgi:TfoX/Sxy family transcriptional regulator of competence genes
MAYDEELADRVRALTAHRDGVTEKKMFGGHAFLVNGNLALSASGQGGLLLRVDPAALEVLLSEDGVSRFEMRGRELDGWVHVQHSATHSEEQLRRWVDLGVEHAASLPPKSGDRPRGRRHC